MSRIALDKIPALTFYKNALTKARRSSAIAQLVCVGKPCTLYQPEVVHCTNVGGSGTDVDWRCEADLPSSLRFGKVEVSCEGWNGPGDPYVMKGSCSLEYQLIQLPNALRDDTRHPRSSLSSIPRFFREMDASGIVFMLVWLVVLALIMYSFFNSCIARFRGRPEDVRPSTSYGSSNNSGGSGGRGGGGGGGRSFPFMPSSPPPPYSKDPPVGAGGEQWRPGFWSGAALGAVANHLWNRNREPTYDWERERMGMGMGSSSSFMGGGGSPAAARRRSAPSFANYEDHGEGPSGLGGMRTATGYGSSRSR